MPKIINQTSYPAPVLPFMYLSGTGRAGYVFQDLRLTLPAAVSNHEDVADITALGRYIINERNQALARITKTAPVLVSPEAYSSVGTKFINNDYTSTHPFREEDFPAGSEIMIVPDGANPFYGIIDTWIDNATLRLVDDADADAIGPIYIYHRLDVEIDAIITDFIAPRYDDVNYDRFAQVVSLNEVGAEFREGDVLAGESVRFISDSGTVFNLTVDVVSASSFTVTNTGVVLDVDGYLIMSPFKWKIVEVPCQRIIDYKVKADIKNFFYFSESAEWVVYHTVTGEAYYGNRFFPWIGAIACYDENDSQIYPSDIIYYPEVISNGIYESAKTVIRWPYDPLGPTPSIRKGKQAGKVCFNEGFSKCEDGDQSRLILNVVAGDFYIGDDDIYRNKFFVLYSTRASAITTTEPFMTVDAIANGRVCACAFPYYTKADAGADPDQIKRFPYMSRVRVRSDLQMFRAIDSVIGSSVGNPDILYRVTLKAADISELVGDEGWFQTYQNQILRPLDDQFYYINVADLPVGSVDSRYGLTKLYVDNIGYYHDDGDDLPFRFVLYCHGKPNGETETEWAPEGSKKTIAEFTGDEIEVEAGEPWRPLLKIGLAGGYVKIIKRVIGFGEKILPNGELEREYVIEIPCARSMHNRIRLNEFVFISDLGDANYSNRQILVPVSYIREGAIAEDHSERIRVVGSKLFTKMVFAASDNDIPLQTYGRVSGGGIYEAAVNRGDVLDYPKLSVFREVVPQLLESVSDAGVVVEVLSGSSGGHEQVFPDFEAKLFILYDNRKWRFNKVDYESFNCGPYPAWVFEVDATALLQELDIINNPSFPDIKRWFRGYCRGFGLTVDPTTRARIGAQESGSELVLEIWDNKSSVISTFTCDASISVGSTTVRNNDFYWNGSNCFNDDMVGKSFTIGIYTLTVASVTGPGEIETTAPAVANVREILTITEDIVMEKPNWRSLTPSHWDQPDGYYDSDPSTGGYISEQRIFQFGGQKTVGVVGEGYVHRDSYLDLKLTKTDTETGNVYKDIERYIDVDNKIRFRARIQPKVVETIKKLSTDRDTRPVSHSGYDWDVWGAGDEVVSVTRLEEIDVSGTDFFKTESL